MERRRSDKIASISIIGFFLVIALFFAALLCNCVYQYCAYDTEYSDLTFGELTFERYEKIDQGKYGQIYRLYFREYAEPFSINRITNRKLDKAALDAITGGEPVSIYYCEKESRFSQYEICEISCSGHMLLSLSDYVAANQSNQIVGIVFCPIMILSGILVAWIFFRASKPVDRENLLGKMRIERRIDGNVVRVYNSVHMCSLMINDRVVDTYCGVFGDSFCLKGRITAGGKTMHIEARMGAVFMRLYCEGELIARRFMALG